MFTYFWTKKTTIMKTTTKTLLLIALTSSIFMQEFGSPTNATNSPTNSRSNMADSHWKDRFGIGAAQTGSTIEELAKGFRHMVYNVSFNNTIELNSTIYFCRINHNEFNYSSNPTYLTGSKIVVKNQATDLPVSYITSIGL